MKDKIVRRICSILLGLAILVIIAGATSTYFESPPPNGIMTGSADKMKIKTIEVSGTGIVSMTPDEAIVYMGVQTKSADAVTSQKDNAARMEKVINALADAGIAKDNMETSSYTMYPVKDNENGENITGYVVSNQLKVTIKDINKTGIVIDKAVKAGANEINSISFTLSDESQQKVREQALKNAVKAARLDADRLAGELGVIIKAPLQVSTGGGIITTPTVEVKSLATPIMPAGVTVSAFVSVIYQFE
ncbi:MAG TPA: SIMPL domain-containing protein [Candidatus Methanoperedens sp.]|nr:SIMPL domain-containing protein [Candidatus Methanoperedens sp.]